MNRAQRRAEAARNRDRRANVIAVTLDYLATAAATATGATIIMPDGETLYIAAETAKAKPARGAKGGLQ